MFTKTSVSAIRALTYLGLDSSGQPISPRHMAEQLGESPTYLAKVARHLVKVGILRAHRGVAGGVTLNRSPDDISLLAIVEACQGAILGDFCQEAEELDNTCAFHQAGAELHAAIVGILSRWTLAQLLLKPCPSETDDSQVQCLLESLRGARPRAAAKRTSAKRSKPASSPNTSDKKKARAKTV
ncbi:MAG: Rrf2 family transcriptional regulator [Planctomycetes bacterium]|nr:Rrf2 family transcriptional regulator [Planctomycetota bacterium]MBL7039293.1 Rrf2 family transcriptional regulator [Pirellulaceae bacterium]